MKKKLLILLFTPILWAYSEFKISQDQLVRLGIQITTIDNKIPSKGLPFNAYIDFNDKSSMTQNTSFDVIVVALYKREGEQIKKGEKIGEVSSVELSNLYFDLQNTQNKFKVTQDIAKKDRELYKAGVISKREYQNSYLSAEEMELKLKQIESTFLLFGINPKNPKGKYGFVVVAGNDGILSVAPKQTGERIPAFSPYIRISRDNNLLARIKIPLNASSYIKKDLSVFDRNGRKIGAIQSVSVVLDKASNTILATAVLDHGNFKVGQTIDVYLGTLKSEDSLLISSKSLIKNGKDYLVFKKIKNGFIPVPVKIIEERSKQFVIIGDGLKLGDEIASGALIALKGIINNIGDE